MRKPAGDETEALVAAWADAVPEINPKVERVVDRLMISAKYLERLAYRLSALRDLQRTDYEILARLFWVGPPYRLRPSQLAAGTMAPPTSITSRLDRLERRGLVGRVSDPKDRRVLAAELTEEGRQLFVEIVGEQAVEERAIFEQFSARELESLDRLLRKLMSFLDERLGPAPRRVSMALGTEE
jgi:DNA-binding MarR family transcriptional regulator